MPFLGLLELLIVDASRLEQSMPPDIRTEAPLQQLDLPSDSQLEVVPFVIEGSVESFDPAERAKELAETIARKWCGTYRSFNDGSNVDVTLHLSQVNAIGQIIDLQGQLLIDGIKTNVRGHLNAKSNQIELILISKKWISDIEPGGVFLGLEDTKRLIWNSPRLTNLGGRLDLNQACRKKISKAKTIFTIF